MPTMRGLFELVLRCGLTAVLALAGLLKLCRPRSAADAFRAFRLESARSRTLAVVGVAVVELALALGVGAGSSTASFAAAGLMVVFACALATAIRLGARGAPCPCFGSRGRIGYAAIVRNLVLAAGFLVLPFVGSITPSTEAWLGVGLGLALGGVAILAVAVLALAREVGMLRLRVPPESALELLSEGPDLGRFAPIVDGFSMSDSTRIALAVFTSPGCRICRSLEPAIAALARTPTVSVRVFDEERDRDAWEELRVPGSPYAVAMDLDGTVRAKGTFNTLAQLESVVATAQRRAEASAARA